jgi:hypothetical protein
MMPCHAQVNTADMDAEQQKEEPHKMLMKAEKEGVWAFLKEKLQKYPEV